MFEVRERAGEGEGTEVYGVTDSHESDERDSRLKKKITSHTHEVSELETEMREWEEMRERRIDQG